jgi:hypothetical protein
MLLQMSAVDCGQEAVEVFECNVDMILPQFSAQCSLLCIMMFLVCKSNVDTHVTAKLIVTVTDIL